jgi:hypothetical protein
METIKYFDLNFESAIEYLKDNLEGTNALSSEVMNVIHFNKGNFFTFLPSSTEAHNINDFRYGWSEKIGIRSLIGLFLLNIIKNDSQLTCIFDDFNNDFRIGYEDELFLSHGLSFGKEIYYAITAKTASLPIIEKCVRYSISGTWHSLCVLTKSDLKKDTKTLNLEEIKDICSQAVAILVGAYDAQSYVIWAKDDCGISFQEILTIKDRT